MPDDSHSHPAPSEFPAARMFRRQLLLGIGAAALSGCMTERRRTIAEPPAPPPTPPMYFAMEDDGHYIPEVNMSQFNPAYIRTEVDFETDERPGTLIVDTPNQYLYHVHGDGRATRYGIGVGRSGFSWSGRANVGYKRKWPRWVPPAEMIAREPDLEPYSSANGGMAPGINNPLGSRALYIFRNGKDTIYLIHGSREAWSIGRAVSSGCIRMINQDIIHLYDRVDVGAPIVVLPDLSEQTIESI